MGFLMRPPTRAARCSESSNFDDTQDVIFTNDEVVLAGEICLGSTVFSEENAVPDLHVGLAHAPVLLNFAIADGQHFTLGRLFLGRIRNDDSALALALLFHATNDDMILKRANFGHRTDLLGNLQTQRDAAAPTMDAVDCAWTRR